jgi:hypothetical protein
VSRRRFLLGSVPFVFRKTKKPARSRLRGDHCLFFNPQWHWPRIGRVFDIDAWHRHYGERLLLIAGHKRAHRLAIVEYVVKHKLESVGKNLFGITDGEKLLLIVRVVLVSRHSIQLLWLSGVEKKHGERTA